MLDIIFVLLFFFTVILMIYGISERNLSFVFMTALLWFMLALFMLQGIERPYELYNLTSGNIETGVHTITANLDPLAYLFMGFGALMFIVFVTFTMETLSDYKKIK